jgi:hypothetical protein
VRSLLVDEETTLAVALDELLSLARQVAAEHKPDVPLGERVRALFDKDKRYAEALGPHRLTRQEIDAPEAFQWLPPELWYDTLGALIRLFPGIGSDSICRARNTSRGSLKIARTSSQSMLSPRSNISTVFTRLGGNWAATDARFSSFLIGWLRSSRRRTRRSQSVI